MFSNQGSRGIVLFALCWCVLAAISLAGGPALGDHEVIVAQTARQILQSGEWITLRYLDTPFLVKPPMAPWLVALFSSVLPGDAVLHQPVNDWTARLPSVIATALTVLVITSLGRSMFGRRTGFICGFVYATCIGALLYAFNATTEALLTLFCTWSYAEFWWFYTATVPRKCTLHLALFYLALGLGMLAKGPMPLAVVVVPLACWWFLHRAGQIFARGGLRAFPSATRRFVRDLWPRLRFALTRMGLWWGIPLFLLPFAPWMVAVARRVPYFLQLLRFEYVDRLEGFYPGSKSDGWFYYIPIMAGLMLPWALSVPQAMAAPFNKHFRGLHRPVAYAWYWTVIALIVLSAMSFKKPYYILPALPGLALLLGPVLDRLFFSTVPNLRRARFFIVVAISIFVIAGVVSWFVGRAMYPEVWNATISGVSALSALLAAIGFAWAGRSFLHGEGGWSLLKTGLTCLVVFTLCWRWAGPSASKTEESRELVARLKAAGIPDDAEIYWAGQRPDGRIQFYGGRKIRQAVDPYKLVAEAKSRISGGIDLRQLVGEEICRLLSKPQPVYCVIQRENFGIFKRLICEKAEEIFTVDRGAGGKDWVVCGNEAAKASVKIAALQ